MLAIIIVLIVRMPVPLDDALHIAGAAGRLQVFDFSFDLTKTYTFWSGIIGGTFLMLSYFGTDQSQVQRYLAAKSVDEARSSLLMSAYWKIPLQALILLIGVLVFLFYLFTPAPLLYNPRHERAGAAAGTRAVRRSAGALRRRPSARARPRRVRPPASDTPAPTPQVRASLDAFRAVEAERDRDSHRGARRGGARQRRVVARRELHHSALRARQSAARFRRPLPRRGAGRRDVEHRGRAELALDGHRRRLLSALVPARRPATRTS